MESGREWEFDAQELQVELRLLGASDEAVNMMRVRLQHQGSGSAFQIEDAFRKNGNHIGVVINIEAPRTGTARISSYQMTVRKEVEIPQLEINGVNTQYLEARMRQVNWRFEMPDHEYIGIESRADVTEGESANVPGIERDLKILRASGSSFGALAADNLMVKYWLDTPYETFINDASEYKQLFDIRRSFTKEDIVFPTFPEAMALIAGYPIGRSVVSKSEGKPGYDWYQLNKENRDMYGRFTLEKIGFFDLDDELRKLAAGRFDISDRASIALCLSKGISNAIQHQEGDRSMVAVLKVNAHRNTVEVWSSEGKFVTDSGLENAANRRMENLSCSLNGTIVRNRNYSESNLDYIQARLLDHGLPDTQYAVLHEEMKNGSNRILLEFHSVECAGNVRAIAEVNKMESGAYLLTRYLVQLKKPEWVYPRQQNFRVCNGKDHGKAFDIHWKTAVNLLAGGQALVTWPSDNGMTVFEWRGLDFSKKSQDGYGFVSFESSVFSVERKLDDLPIMEKDRADLRHSFVVRSIELGNSQSVHLLASGNPTIRLRANVPRRELDIIQGGRVLSLDQFKEGLNGYEEMIRLARELDKKNGIEGKQEDGGGLDASRTRRVLLNTGGAAGSSTKPKNQFKHGI